MQQRRRGGAVDVVVAEHGDLLVARDGLQKALDRRSMSRNPEGSGNSSRKVGLRNDAALSIVTSRAASRRPTSSGMPKRCAMARPCRSSARRWRHLRPPSDRSTPRNARSAPFIAKVVTRPPR
jgi:hypothetical protein